MSIRLSDHACRRSAQRNLSYDEINFVITHGKRLRRTGVIYYQMHARRMPDDIPPHHPYRRLVGTTVMLDSTGQVVITVYRNDEAFKKDLRKAKYRWNKWPDGPAH